MGIMMEKIIDSILNGAQYYNKLIQIKIFQLCTHFVNNQMFFLREIYRKNSIYKLRFVWFFSMCSLVCGRKSSWSFVFFVLLCNTVKNMLELS